jgi:hypothetical protein
MDLPHYPIGRCGNNRIAIDFFPGLGILPYVIQSGKGKQPPLIATMTGLEERGIGFKSLTENIDTTTSGGKLISVSSAL